MAFITPDQHVKNEWSRLAQAAYAAGFNRIGHKYSAAAALPAGTRMQAYQYKDLQDDYVYWADFGEWPR